MSADRGAGAEDRELEALVLGDLEVLPVEDRDQGCADEGADELGPIAVEPYGSVTTQGKAYRQPKQQLDFYTLLDNWLLKDQVPPVEQQHFVMAVLIRGGVFGEAS